MLSLQVPDTDVSPSTAIIDLYPIAGNEPDSLIAAIRSQPEASRVEVISLIESIVNQTRTKSWASPSANLVRLVSTILEGAYTLSDPLEILNMLLNSLAIPAQDAEPVIQKKQFAANAYLLREIFTLMKDKQNCTAAIRYLYQALCKRIIYNQNLITSEGYVDPSYLDLAIFITTGYNPAEGTFAPDAGDKIRQLQMSLELQLLSDEMFQLESIVEPPAYDEVIRLTNYATDAATNIGNLTWILAMFDPDLALSRPHFDAIDSQYRDYASLKRMQLEYTGRLPIEEAADRILQQTPSSGFKQTLVAKLTSIAQVGILLNMPSERFYDNVLNAVNNLLLMGINDQTLRSVITEMLAFKRLSTLADTLKQLTAELEFADSPYADYWTTLRLGGLEDEA